MLYERPIYRPLGDMFVDVEFGDELHLALNFRVIGLNLSLLEQPIPGVTETVPSNRALMIAYDSSIIRQATLIDSAARAGRGGDEATTCAIAAGDSPFLVQRPLVG